ncbi:Protein VHS3 (Viable in a HAL3 SIT4 background protein 3) [Schistosoma japonicum]|nr:Protein VHS3 (Viable in a HAL3 SIT4 background protein 3) [Schistosoma japonicum]KAH8878340.1 Protein VHS3 (Viable in a HAL3 SIT4 background protein 3) [Schistosoma japonicum]
MKLSLSVLLYCIFVYLQMNCITCIEDDTGHKQRGSEPGGAIGVSSLLNPQDPETNSKESCVISATPMSCSDIKKKTPGENELSSKSCTTIIQLLTSQKTLTHGKPKCYFVKFLGSDMNTIFALHDILYTSIEATQFTNTTLLETMKENNKHLDVPLDFERCHLIVFGDPLTRRCNECQHLCPEYSQCKDVKNGISCVCQSGWISSQGNDNREYCEVHTTSVPVLYISLILFLIFILLLICLMRKTDDEKKRKTNK